MREDRAGHWAQTISQQEASGLGVRAFCRERGVCAASFYGWRRRLRRGDGAVGFALIETKPAATGEASLELIFITGERLRIGRGVDAATLQTTLSAIRA